MTTYLLDANVVIALVVAEHEHHDAANTWLAAAGEFALCPITEGALARFLLRAGETGATVDAVLAGLHASPLCTFWPDEISYRDVALASLAGHRQATDAYLAALVAHRDTDLVTFDRALAARHDRVLLLDR